MFRPLRNKAVLAACVLFAGCNGTAAEQTAQPAETVDVAQAGEKETLGLFTTLPIYWGEGSDIGSILDGQGEAGWVREALEDGWSLKPLDALEPDTLDGLTDVLLAQPRPLAPSENVAFDAWVRGGGRALIFADPLLTQHSDFPLGDPRRPHDMVVFSPLFRHWNLRLVFDDEQPEGEREIDGVPVDLAGRFEIDSPGGESPCDLSAGGLIADCRIGNGRAVLVADAALLDDHHRDESREDVLNRLLERGFGI